MDEKEYRTAYNKINPIRCVFEKAINSRTCNCSQSTRFNLADREGVSCNTDDGQKLCSEILTALRSNARFVLQQKSIGGELPHNAEIKIQNGGVKGIAKVMEDDQFNESDIFSLFSNSMKKYKCVDEYPFSEIIQEISSYQGRRKVKREK